MSEKIRALDTKSEILTERRGNAGLITLNRPKALNALSLAMVRELLATLRTWRDDPAVHLWRFAAATKPEGPARRKLFSVAFVRVETFDFFIRP